MVTERFLRTNEIRETWSSRTVLSFSDGQKQDSYSLIYEKWTPETKNKRVFGHSCRQGHLSEESRTVRRQEDREVRCVQGKK